MSIYLKKEGNYLMYFTESLREIAYSLDQTGNVLCKDLFRIFISKNSTHTFGNPDETISGVLGKNEREETLTKVGKVLVWILNKLDHNHTKKAIEEDEN